VIQIGSPRSIAVGLQRIGRAGHWVGALPKGRILATTRDELIECAALCALSGTAIWTTWRYPKRRWTFLAQQIVAAAACEDFGEDELYDFVRGRTHIAISRVRISTTLSRCSPTALPRGAGAAARTCIAIR